MSRIVGTTDRLATASRNRVAMATAKRTVRLDGAVTLSSYFRWKPWVDRLLALLLLCPVLLATALIGLVVRLTSRGPAIYRQRRVGRDGQVYWFYKIRTMRQQAENGRPLWAASSDRRTTPVGRWLRRFHLDELPQLFNVLKGEMSLVGPRPERPEFVEVLLDAVPGYEQRLRVLPGVTGLAQLNLPPDTDLCCVCRKVVLDLDYLENASLWLDLRILLCTFLKLLKLPWVDWNRLLGLAREVTIHGCPSAHEHNGRKGPGEPVSPENLHCPVKQQVIDGNGADRRAAAAHSARNPHRSPKPR